MTRTTITSHLYHALRPGLNVAYCATFQLAWNRKLQIIGGPLLTEPASQVVEALNRRLVAETDVDEDSVFARAGHVQDGILDVIHSEMQRRFHYQPKIPDVDAGLVFYAFLRKVLSFTPAFEVASYGLRFNNEGRVHSFGCWSDKQLVSQVEIVDYVDDHDFIVRLHHADGEGDELIVACVLPKPSLLETIDRVSARVAAGDALGPRASQRLSLRDDETFQIPEVQLYGERQFKELLGLGLLNPGYAGWFIAEARQSLAFSLNEHGVKLESEAWGLDELGLDASDPKRQLIVDRPFLVWVRRRGSRYPYLALWVDNVDVLRPVE